MTGQRITIALDGMGGDHAPLSVVDSLSEAIVKYPEADFIVFGDSQKLVPLVEAKKFPAGRVSVSHAPSAITGDAKPSVALRTGRDSSMRLAIDCVAEGKAHAIVSGGNTGALMAMALFVLRPLPGIERPALTSLLPSSKGDIVMLDLGANVEVDSENLVQFAIMGSAFAGAVLGKTKPSVGLLNVGSEETKGKDSLREAARLMKESPNLPWNFYGFVEGNDINTGTVDVVVTDGFTGNVALKTMEGTAKLFVDFLKKIFESSSWVCKLGYLLAKPAFKTLKERMDPRRYNGAVFLGLQGICVKSHGSMDAVGFATAIGIAHDLVKHGSNETIKTQLAQLSPLFGSALQET
jgi:glycerol-3-phosphate acyltransferase PlsX